MLSLRSSFKRAASAVGGKDGSAERQKSSPWSTVLTVALVAAAAAIIYFRFLR